MGARRRLIFPQGTREKMYNELQRFDPDVFDAVRNEIRRQHTQLEMIASENHVSPAIIETIGNPMTNKYAEGYPGERYYGGCEFVDVAENLALARERKSRLAGDHRDHRQPDDQQVRRGLSGRALLRRVRVCRCRRKSRACAREGTLWRGVGQRAAAFGFAGEHGRVHVVLETGRYGVGHGPGPWRASHARFAEEFLRAALPLRRVWDSS